MSATTTVRPNTFEEVVIGTQIWMKRNYDFGGSYPNNDETLVTDYGKLYSWAEAMAINVPGWHLPTATELNTFAFNTGWLHAERIMESGTTHWVEGNVGDNVDGFTAVGAGLFDSVGVYVNFKQNCGFWTSTEIDANNATCLQLVYNSIVVNINNSYKTLKFSVRLIKN